MSRFLVIVLSCSLLLGCGTTPKQSVLKEKVVPLEAKKFFDHKSSQQMRVGQFVNKRTTWTERNKIDYLLGAIRGAPITFVRNSMQYTGSQAAGWLRWKMFHWQFRQNPIRTARDFIDRVATRSNRSGLHYAIILADGHYINLLEVLNNELASLEQALMANVVRIALDKKSVTDARAIHEKVQTSVGLPVSRAPSS